MSTPATTLTVVTPAELLTIAKDINATHASAKNHAKLSIIFAIRTGILCQRAKERIEHGAFTEWLEKNCPTISTRTARKYMALAEGMKTEGVPLLTAGTKTESSSVLAEATLTAPGFLDKIERSENYREEITAGLTKLIGESSLTDLFRDYDIIRAPGNVDEKTGKRIHYAAKNKKLSPEQVAEENRAAANARIFAAITALKNATDDKLARRWLGPKDWLKIDKLVGDRKKAIEKYSGAAHAAAKGAK